MSVLDEEIFAQRCRTPAAQVRWRRSWSLQVDHGMLAVRLSGKSAAALQPGRRHKLHADDHVVLCREICTLDIHFDTLCSEDRHPLEFRVRADAITEDAVRFCTRYMAARDVMNVDELCRIVQSELKPAARDALHDYATDDLGKTQVLETIAGELASVLGPWTARCGLRLEEVRVIECRPALEAQRVKLEVETALAAGEAGQKETLDQLIHEAALRKDERLREAVDSEEATVVKLRRVHAVLEEMQQEEKLRCQGCHRKAGPQELFTCRDCHRTLCRAHEADGTGRCHECDEETRLTVCPISGHNVKKEDTFTCRKCKVVACNNCYDRDNRTCVNCAAEAARKTDSVMSAEIHALLGKIREVPQVRDLRIWSDSNSPATRGVGVAPRGDIREFSIGERDIRINLHPDMDGYLRIFVVQSDGTAVPLFPNEHHGDYYLAGGKVFGFPDPESHQFRYNITPPAGLDTLVAVMAGGPFRIWDDDLVDAADGTPAPSNQRMTRPAKTVEVLADVLARAEKGELTCALCRILVKETHG